MVVGSWKRTPFVCVPLQWLVGDGLINSHGQRTLVARGLFCLPQAPRSIVTSSTTLTHTKHLRTDGRTRDFSWRQVAKVKKLKPRDAAQLLVDKVPTRFTKAELGLPSDCTREDILAVLEAHPVLQAADGHPGTLVRVPSSVKFGLSFCGAQRLEEERIGRSHRVFLLWLGFAGSAKALGRGLATSVALVLLLWYDAQEHTSVRTSGAAEAVSGL